MDTCDWLQAGTLDESLPCLIFSSRLLGFFQLLHPTRFVIMALTERSAKLPASLVLSGQRYFSVPTVIMVIIYTPPRKSAEEEEEEEEITGEQNISCCTSACAVYLHSRRASRRIPAVEPHSYTCEWYRASVASRHLYLSDTGSYNPCIPHQPPIALRYTSHVHPDHLPYCCCCGYIPGQHQCKSSLVRSSTPILGMMTGTD